MRPALLLALVLGAATVLAVEPVRPASAEEDDEASLLISDARDALASRKLTRAATLLDRAIAADPRRIDAFVLRASIHVAQRQYGEALALLGRARKLAPRSLDVLEALGGAEVLGGDADAGVALLEQVVRKEPRRYQASAVLGIAYGKRGEWARAIPTLRGYLDSRPSSLASGDHRYRLALAQAQLRSGEVEAARKLYAEIVEQRPTSVLARLGHAWATASISCTRAMPLLRGLDDLVDDHPEVLSVHSRCALLLDDLDDAIATASRYRKLRPEAAEAHAVLGEAYFAKGDESQALASMSRAVELDPGNGVYTFKLARTERRAGKPAEAARRLSAATPPADFADDWTVELGQARYEAGQLAEARAVLAPFVAGHREHPIAQVVLGLTILELGDHDAAIPHLQQGLRLGSDDDRLRPALVRALERRAVDSFAAGQLEAAERDLLAASEVLDDDAVWRNLGAVRLQRGDGKGALDALRRAGSDAVATYLLGRAHLALGELDDAVKAMRAAARNPPDATFAADVAIDLASALQRRGDLVDAVTTLDKAMSGDQDDDQAIRLRTAYFTMARAAATDALSDGRFAAAYELLDAAHEQLTSSGGNDLRIAIECDLALAATATARRDQALELLRGLVKRKAVCPYVAPADALAIEILIAWNEGGVAKRAKAALKKLDALHSTATGPAASLVTIAARDIALRAAIDAYDRGKTRDAQTFLATARRYDKQSDEIDHNLAVLEIAAGKPAQAISVLTRLAKDVPEALINLGIAWDAQGQPDKAVEAWQAALTARARHPRLEEWIATKRRLWRLP